MSHHPASLRIAGMVESMWKAKAPTSLSPPSVPTSEYGEHCSYVPRPGTRLWGFPTRADRDRFVRDYWHLGARTP